MTHDKIKAAARRRMAQTGEPYKTARHEVIMDYRAGRHTSPATSRRSMAATPHPDTIGRTILGAAIPDPGKLGRAIFGTAMPRRTIQNPD
jgi:hypothetical protein